jgi:hypothetical protein
MTIIHQYKIIILTLAIFLSACSKQSWYTGAQSSQTAHCMEQPLAEYNDCMQQSNESYNEYTKSRQDLIKESSDTNRENTE